MNRIVEPKRTGNGLPKAKIEKGRLTWLLWLIPLGALCLCGWFIYRDYVAMGPEITIHFQSADGLEANNTELQYRGAVMGQLKDITLAKDKNSVVVKAQLVGSARSLARTGSLFWIVRPEVKVGSISGLRTIISGDYIAIQPGDGPPTNAFVGVEQEPIPDSPGALQITLMSPQLDSVEKESPVFYRGIQVGEVLNYQLATNAQQIVIHARIWKEYAPLVRGESKFWNAGGLNIHAGLFKGIQIQAESPATILSGGIAFATPPDYRTSVTNGATFVLNEKEQDEWKKWSPNIGLQLVGDAVGTNQPGASSLLK